MKTTNLKLANIQLNIPTAQLDRNTVLQSLNARQFFPLTTTISPDIKADVINSREYSVNESYARKVGRTSINIADTSFCNQIAQIVSNLTGEKLVVGPSRDDNTGIIDLNNLESEIVKNPAAETMHVDLRPDPAFVVTIPFKGQATRAATNQDASVHLNLPKKDGEYVTFKEGTPGIESLNVMGSPKNRAIFTEIQNQVLKPILNEAQVKDPNKLHINIARCSGKLKDVEFDVVPGCPHASALGKELSVSPELLEKLKENENTPIGGYKWNSYTQKVEETRIVGIIRLIPERNLALQLQALVSNGYASKINGDYTKYTSKYTFSPAEIAAHPILPVYKNGGLDKSHVLK